MLKLIMAVAMAVIALPALAVQPGPGIVSPVSTMERISNANLPQDGDKLFLTIAGNANDATFKRLLAGFKNDSALVEIKNETHFNALTTDSAMFKARYAKSMPKTPIVRLQAPDGTVIYEAIGNDIPTSGLVLADDLNAKASGCDSAAGCRWRNRRCQPKQEEAAPHEEEQPIVAPEPEPKPEPKPAHAVNHPLILATVVLVSLLIGGAIGAYQYLKRGTRRK
jgi:hypothetical protein